MLQRRNRDNNTEFVMECSRSKTADLFRMKSVLWAVIHRKSKDSAGIDCDWSDWGTALPHNCSDAVSLKIQKSAGKWSLFCPTCYSYSVLEEWRATIYFTRRFSSYLFTQRKENSSRWNYNLFFSLSWWWTDTLLFITCLFYNLLFWREKSGRGWLRSLWRSNCMVL